GVGERDVDAADMNVEQAADVELMHRIGGDLHARPSSSSPGLSPAASPPADLFMVWAETTTLRTPVMKPSIRQTSRPHGDEPKSASTPKPSTRPTIMAAVKSDAILKPSPTPLPVEASFGRVRAS